ncbi:MAG: ribonuclease P protein component 2 [Nanoarchaeota archaeon]|nr:ribonuclease P protein component 2 [Nanoarchaeota archaeon]
MKTILPSLKEKKRYLAFEIVSGDKFNKTEIKNAITEEALKFMGTLNYGKAGIMLTNLQENSGILKVNNKFLNELKSSLILIKDINSKRVIFKTKGVSGILKKAKNKYLKKEAN